MKNSIGGVSMDIDYSLDMVVADSLENDAHSDAGEEVNSFGESKTEHLKKERVNRKFDLNKLPKDDAEMDVDDLYCLVVADSTESDCLLEEDDEETTFKGRAILNIQDRIIEKMEVQLNDSNCSSSSDVNGKKLFDLNKYPEERFDIGHENEEMNKMALTMLKIYVPRLF